MGQFPLALQKYLLYFMILITFALEVEAIRRRRKKGVSRKSGRGHHSMSQFLYVMLLFIGVVVVPLIATFVYKIYKDPATPGIIRYYWENFKKNGFGYLGKESKTKRKKVRNA